MKPKFYILFCYFTIVFGLGLYAFTLSKQERVRKMELSYCSMYDTRTPISLKMYALIEKYSSEYNIPKYVAYNIAYRETRYKGPFHWNYNPYQTSYAGAEGPMQVMIKTCNGLNKSRYSKKELRKNLDLNVHTSMKLLSRLHKKYKNWSVVCGWYNTGRPIVNEYGKYCGTNLNYKSKWVQLD